VISAKTRTGLVVGIAGPIGSGKSTLSRMLADLGAEVISGDRVGREVLESDEGVRRELAEVFGPEALGPGGAIDRRVLAERAFRSKESAAELNRIVHPSLVERLRRRMREHRERGDGVLVIDAALIPEWGMEAEMDVHVHVTASREQRMERWCGTENHSSEDFQRRERCQLEEEQKQRNANVVITNNGDKEGLRGKAEGLWDLLGKIRAGEYRLTRRVTL